MENLKLFGRKIKALRKSKDLTQEKLAELVEISTRHIANLEAGLNQPSSNTLKKIAKALDVEVSALYNNDYYDDPKVLKSKILNKIDKLNEEQLRVLYRFTSTFD